MAGHARRADAWVGLARARLGIGPAAQKRCRCLKDADRFGRGFDAENRWAAEAALSGWAVVTSLWDNPPMPTRRWFAPGRGCRARRFRRTPTW